MHENASKPKVAKYFKLLSNKVWSDVSNNLADKSVMILRNHGLLSVGSSIAHAFIRLHTLERACHVQMLARSLNEELIEVSDNIAKAHANEIENADKGELAFNSLLRLMDKIDPSFRN